MADQSYDTDTAWSRLTSFLDSQHKWNSRYVEIVDTLKDELRVAESIICRESGNAVKQLVPLEAMTPLLVNGHDFNPSDAVWAMKRFNHTVDWVVNEYARGCTHARLAIGEWLRRGDGLIPPPKLPYPTRMDWVDNHGCSPEYFQQHYFKQSDGILSFITSESSIMVSAEYFDALPTTCAALLCQAQTLMDLLQRLTTYLTVTTSQVQRLITLPLARNAVAVKVLTTQFSPFCKLQPELISLIEGVIAMAYCIKQRGQY